MKEKKEGYALTEMGVTSINSSDWRGEDGYGDVSRGGCRLNVGEEEDQAEGERSIM